MPSPAPAGERLAPIDALRGLIMVLMAVDHASFFVAKRHASEFWGVALPEFPGAVAFLTRLVTHLCAPGFFLLMGVGIVLFADSRRRRGWSSGRVSRFLAWRGLLLIVVQQVIENPAWAAGIFAARGQVETYGLERLPGGDGMPMFLLAVLFALGASLIFWSVAARLRVGTVAAISVGALLATELLMPAASQVATVFPALWRVLLIPGQSDLWVVLYPVVPWLGACGLGVVLGQLLVRDRRRAFRLSAWGGVAFLGLFVLLRAGGGFGNLHPPEPGWIGFLNLTKYPPSLAFLLLTLGGNLLLLELFRRLEGRADRWTSWLLVFGRSPLFFYLAHIYLFLLIGLAFPGIGGFGRLYASWGVGLVILYPLCRWFERFKRARGPGSLWRFF